MNIETQFNLIAEQYDQNRKKFVPCFDDYYQNTTKLIAANLAKPTRIFGFRRWNRIAVLLLVPAISPIRICTCRYR